MDRYGRRMGAWALRSCLPSSMLRVSFHPQALCVCRPGRDSGAVQMLQAAGTLSRCARAELPNEMHPQSVNRKGEGTSNSSKRTKANNQEIGHALPG